MAAHTYMAYIREYPSPVLPETIHDGFQESDQSKGVPFKVTLSQPWWAPAKFLYFLFLLFFVFLFFALSACNQKWTEQISLQRYSLMTQFFYDVTRLVQLWCETVFELPMPEFSKLVFEILVLFVQSLDSTTQRIQLHHPLGRSWFIEWINLGLMFSSKFYPDPIWM